MSHPLLTKSRDRAVRDRLAILFVAVSLSVVVLYRHWPASRLWIPAALSAIAVAIWHGAYDTVLAGDLLQPRFAGNWLIPFVVSYVSLAAAIVFVWYACPVAALVSFLVFSAWHFGMETESGQGSFQRAGAVAFGCLPIAAACHWQPRLILPIFNIMLRTRVSAAGSIIAGAGALLVPCVVLATASAWRERGLRERRAALIVGQMLLFRFCAPVPAFAVFFCLLHTPEHLIETSRDSAGLFSAQRMWRNLRAGIVPWLSSLAAMGAAAWMGRRTMQEYTALLFIALSALTVPHMTLAMLATADAGRKEKHPLGGMQKVVHS